MIILNILKWLCVTVIIGWTIVGLILFWSFKQTRVEIRDHRTLSYSDLLNTVEWEEKRAEILERDYYKCRHCGSSRDLQVHHKYYCKYPNGKKVYPWNYPNDAFITLCKDCHKKVHENKTIKVYYRRYNDNYN